MKKGLRTALLITGSALLMVGAGLTVGGCKAQELASTVRTIDLSDKDVKNFKFDLKTTEVEFKVSTDSSKKVVIHENDRIYHTDEFKEETLFLQTHDATKWYQHLIPDFTKKLIEVYLPSSSYGNLEINASTGDIKIPSGFTFVNANISLSTGKVEYNSNVEEKVSISTSTGDISVDGLNAKSLSVKRTTGKATIKNVNVTENIKLECSTGKAKLEHVRCAKLEISSSTGDHTLNDVIASDELTARLSTGYFEFSDLDSNAIDIETSTGDVEGTLLTAKTFDCHSNSGKVEVPSPTIGAPMCRVRTTTGKIVIHIKA